MLLDITIHVTAMFTSGIFKKIKSIIVYAKSDVFLYLYYSLTYKKQISQRVSINVFHFGFLAESCI